MVEAVGGCKVLEGVIVRGEGGGGGEGGDEGGGGVVERVARDKGT